MNVMKTAVTVGAMAIVECVLHLILEMSPVASAEETITETCAVEFMILGVGQDAGAPQIGNPDDPAWTDPSKRLLATSAALIDHRSGERYLFEATPDIREQLQMLDEHAPSDKGDFGLSGVFLTHAHIGHYAGLMFFGRESAGTKDLPVQVMPRMGDYLENNGPWDQLVSLENVKLQPMGTASEFISHGIMVTPIIVPHRDEYSETVGYVIAGPNKAVLFLPDLDSWQEWEAQYPLTTVELVALVDYALVDATFYNDNELPGRDMSKIPHPRVTETMDMFQGEPAEIRNKIHFIHINHTNPIRDPDSAESQTVQKRGYNIARRGDRVCLSE